MAWIPLMPMQHMDGKSLVPLIEGDNIESRALYWHHPHYASGHGGVPSAAVRLDDWKLVEFFGDSTIELYNLEKDIGEQNNLAGEMPEKAKTLHTMLNDWRDEVDAQMPSINPDYNPQ
jgi:arylsulfatase A-like enzyme